jgi:TctA family transporter
MDAFLSAISQLGTGTYWVALLVAIVIGTVVGFIPGVGATLVTAIMLPSVLLLIKEPAIGIMLLAMVGSLNNTLDAIPAVLVGLPSSETQVTYLEGHQLARQGKGAHTLGAVYAVSMMGGVIGAIALLLAIPIIKPFILQFSYVEIAMLALFGIAMVALLSKGSMAKGLAAGALGLLLGTVGVDPFSGADRYTFGLIQLWQGLPIITAILGFFALPELIDLTMTREAVASKDAVVSRAEVFRGFRYGLTRWRMVIRQSLFGTFMGAIPGIGGAVIDWLAYAFGISVTKDKEKHNFGKGSLEGVLFAESAANSKAGGQALPTLTLGIPGSTSWAIISVAILSYGLSAGPSMVTQHQDITMLMVITLAIGNIMVALLGLFFTNWLARITRIPYPTVGFMIMGTVFLAAYMDLTQWFVFAILLAMALLGLLMKRYGWPRPPLILGFILGPIVEQNLLSGLSIYGFVGVITRPVALGIFAFLIISVVTLLRMTSTAPALDVPIDELGNGGGNEGSDSIDNPPGQAATDSGTTTTHVGQSLDTVHPPAVTVAIDQQNGRSRLLLESNLAPLLFVIVAAGFAVNALSFPTEARTLPLSTSIAVIGFSLYVLAKQLVKGDGSSGEIMDLGMRSTGMAGSVRAAWVIAGLFSMFILLAGIIGLQYASVVFATIGPLLFLEGRIRWTSGLISGGWVFVFSEFIMFRVLGVIWPDPFILEWLGLIS